jgi:hypothetical protein
MGIFQQYTQQVKYEIYCEQSKQTFVLSIDPIGWSSDDKEFARNEEYHGIFTKFSNSLKFVDKSADFINFQRKLYGIKAKLKLTKYEVHPRSRGWVKTYWGYLAMSTYSFENNEVSLKFNSGGLEEVLKSRESEDVEIDRVETLDGKPIQELETNQVALHGRKIFLKSKWKANNNFNPVELRVWSDAGNTRSQTSAFPMTLDIRSHEQAQSTIPGMNGYDIVGTNGIQILAIFDRTREIRIKGNNLKFKTDIVDGVNLIGNEWSWAFFKVCLTIFENGNNYNVKNRIDLFHAGSGSNIYPNILSIDNGQTFNLNFDHSITVYEGDSIGLEFFIKADLRNFSSSRARFYVDVSDFEGSIFAEEESYFEPTKAKFIFVHDIIERLTEICASKEKCFYSDYFGRKEKGYPIDGFGAFIGVTHGFWIRQFDKLPIGTEDNPNLFKPLTTSLKDAIQNVRAVFNVGMGIEEYRNQERVRIEDLKFFYNRNVTIKLPNQVKKVKRYEAEKYYYSAVNIGYEDGGVYDEAQGLDEPNGNTNFTTIITEVKEIYEAVSSYRTDNYGEEFARRKPYNSYDTLDTSYDDKIWFEDLKKGITNIFEQRKYHDDFEQIPTGIFAPETASNLRLSPVNNLMRHSWVISAGVQLYKSEYLRYSSSTANSQLKTKMTGKPEYSENGNIINSELERPRFVPEWIEFEHECNFDVMQMVQGSTIIQGKEIKNFYGLVEFLNEFNVLETGYLFNLKPNDAGKWKVLKSNK